MSRSDPIFVVHPSSGVPIYRQLIDQVEALVAGGQLQPGDTVPSVRQVAAALGINMMTVSKAWSRLEADGLLQRDRLVLEACLRRRIPVATVIGGGYDDLNPLVERHGLVFRAASEMALLHGL